MAIEWTNNIGEWGFGQDDFDQLKAAGFDANAISQFLNDNKRYFGYGRLNVAPSVRAAVGLNDEWSNATGGASVDLRREGSRRAYDQYIGDLKKAKDQLKTEQERDEKIRLLDEERKKVDDANKQIGDYKNKEADFLLNEAKVKDLETQVSGFQTVRDDLALSRAQATQLQADADSLRQQMDAARVDYDNRAAAAQADYDKRFNDAKSSYESALLSRDQDLSAAKSLAESYKADLSRYRNTEVSQQLSNIRAGSAGASGGASGFGLSGSSGGLGSGRVALSGSGNGGAQVVVDANDSVVNRKGPVVQVIGVGAARRSAAAAGSGGLSSGNGGGYYARRFS